MLPAPIPDLVAAITASASNGALALADVGYEGETATLTILAKKPQSEQLAIDSKAARSSMTPRAAALSAPTFR
ncbi:hypothetical protein ABZX92_29745 [Lentzea sp. NPDC006480]|uniref:hypothetical protein n=1 Tax=Lentzea sp. NPDC006480 TaxID=3157176 RepID=UPI0033A1038B